jgi:putative ABC transport system permease protein
MFVSVKERTHLIGIEKALGARKSFILIQFLTEAITLCVVGGMFGLLLVYGAVSALNGVFELTFILPLSRVVMGIGISVVVGVLSGIIPAYRAANMDPVEAMRS